MEQHTKGPEADPHILDKLICNKDGNGERIFSITDARTSGYPQRKQLPRPLPHTIHTNSLKMYPRPKCKSQNYEASRRKQRRKIFAISLVRQRFLWIGHQNPQTIQDMVDRHIGLHQN